MHKTLILTAALLLSACGDGGIMVYSKTFSLEEMEAAFGVGTRGYTERNPANHAGDFTECSIYMLPRTWYPSDACYHQVKGHELRHCEEGAWHGDEPYMEECLTR